MRKRPTKLLSLLMTVAMALPIFCIGTLPALAEERIVDVDEANTAIVENANSLANGVQAYFKDPSRNYFIVENQQMKFEYNLRDLEESKKMQLVYLKDKAGNSYIENTMDAFVVTKGGETLYASNSNTTASPNLHRFGYYYYDARMEGQNFISEEINNGNVKKTTALKFAVKEAKEITYNNSYYGKVSGTIDNTDDPYLRFQANSSWNTYKADDYQFIRITMSSDAAITGGSFYFSDTETDFDEGRRVNFSISGNGVSGDQMVYYVPMYTNANYKGTILGLRLDFNAIEKGAEFKITNLEVVQVKDTSSYPYGLYVNRDFLVYSDKMHSFTQFTATQELNNVAKVGVEVKIPKTDVLGYVVKADDTLYYDSLPVSDLSSAEYVGFIIEGAGVFGYIMPADNSGGKLTVTDDGENYVISQTLPLDNNTISPSEAGTKNGNDIFMGQRLYTDDNFDLATFITEAENERNPIPKENFIVSDDSNGTYAGYDAIRGCYKFNINSFTGFGTPYYSAQNKQFKINYTIIGEENQDRNIWVMTYGTGGCLECAAILDENEMMIPVPLQVGKNFSEANGERNKFNFDDPTYSEVIYPMDIKKGSENEYTILNMYQNWGQFPIKQLSWIQFDAPYYHISTGVSESNCITPLYNMGQVATNSTLPDFRGMSSPLWSKDPQHNSCGNHRWLIYTDESGKKFATESTANIINSYGPNYASVDMHYITDDGKIKATYTHMEMPQTDENRTYYEMKFEVLKDVTFTDFKNQLQFYSVRSNDPTGYYTRLGYLNDKNESTVVDAKIEESGTAQYVLGDKCPYFSYFDMDNATSQHNEPKAAGYSNVAFLVYNSEISITGVDETPNFIITDRGGEIAVSLDLDGVTLMAGDKITINAILLPWGSQEMEGSYDTIQDQNVRDVRKNTLLDPITAKPTADPTVTNATITTEKVASAFLPRVKTTNGKEAVFTLSGGENNQTVRVDGFKKLTDPKIYELVNGAWVEYNVCSALTPDGNGDGYSYDGYGVYFDSDSETPTYSYTFVVDMTGNVERTFKVVASEDFDGWDITLADFQINQGMNFIASGEKLYEASLKYKDNFGGIESKNENGIDYVRYTSNSSGESSVYLFSSEGSTIITGNYIVMKYRTYNKQAGERIEFHTKTTSTVPNNTYYSFIDHKTDGEWHVVVLDIKQMKPADESIVPDENDGTLRSKFLRVDIFNYVKKVQTFDVAYIGMCDSISEVFSYDPSLTDTKITHITSTPKGADGVYYDDGRDVTKSDLESVNISVKKDTVADINGSFSVPVLIENNTDTGFSYLDIMPTYDKDKFVFTGYTIGDVADEVEIIGNRLIFKNTSDIIKDGTLINLNFKHKSVMEIGSTAEFSVKVVDANNIQGYGVNTVIESGEVTFVIPDRGNVDGDPDNKITLADVMLLRKYLTDKDSVYIDVNNADVDLDGDVDVIDLIHIRKYIANYNFDDNKPEYDFPGYNVDE